MSCLARIEKSQFLTDRDVTEPRLGGELDDNNSSNSWWNELRRARRRSARAGLVPRNSTLGPEVRSRAGDKGAGTLHLARRTEQRPGGSTPPKHRYLIFMSSAMPYFQPSWRMPLSFTPRHPEISRNRVASCWSYDDSGAASLDKN
jgi:hypothetical protein